MATAVENFGGLDVLVNNAGFGHLSSIEDMTEEYFRSQFETNFFGLLHVTRAALPVMRKQCSGHIIQVSSIGGRIGTPGLGAYQASKWAVGGMSEVLAREVKTPRHQGGRAGAGWHSDGVCVKVGDVW